MRRDSQLVDQRFLPGPIPLRALSSFLPSRLSSLAQATEGCSDGGCLNSKLKRVSALGKSVPQCGTSRALGRSSTANLCERRFRLLV